MPYNFIVTGAPINVFVEKSGDFTFVKKKYIFFLHLNETAYNNYKYIYLLTMFIIQLSCTIIVKKLFFFIFSCTIHYTLYIIHYT